MIKKISFLIILSVLIGFVNCQSVFSEPNFQYKVYTPMGYKKEASSSKYDKNSKILFIVDFSNSMNEELGGKSIRAQSRVYISSRVHGIKVNRSLGG